MFYLVWARFRLNFKLKNYLNCKDKIKRELCSLLVYNFKCNSCNAEYIGKLVYKYQRWIQIGISALTDKCVKNNSQTSEVHDPCFFLRRLFVLNIFQFLLRVQAFSNWRFKKVFLWNSERKLWRKVSPQYRCIYFEINRKTNWNVM